MQNNDQPISGKQLNEKWNVNAKHALYSRHGKWYHKLTNFPGALFDDNGYILFETKDDFLNSPYLEVGDEVNIPEGISWIPGYIIKNQGLEDEKDSDEVTYESGSIYPYDMPEEVDIREDAHTVFEWMRKLNSNKLIIDPEFQRNLVWTQKQKSQFIESVILNIPLPALYVNQTRDGKYIIVDGLQRTSTLNEYIHQESFALSQLRVLKNINGFSFSQLEQRFQTRIEDKKLLVYVIKPTVPSQMVYDIFHRINTGGTQLTQQEIRNCFYLGQATRLLKELSEQDYFIRAIDWGISAKRMKDREAVLRYLSFKILDYKTQYKNDMDAFLGEALRRMNLMNIEQLNNLRIDFERVMKQTYTIFGDKNFRLPTETTRGRINIALMESVCFACSKFSDSTMNENKNAILQNYFDLLKNPDYLNAIQFSTGDAKRVSLRFDLAQKILGSF